MVGQREPIRLDMGPIDKVDYTKAKKKSLTVTLTKGPYSITWTAWSFKNVTALKMNAELKPLGTEITSAWLGGAAQLTGTLTLDNVPYDIDRRLVEVREQ